MKQVIKRALPQSLRHAGWRLYYRTRCQLLGAVIGYQTTEKVMALTFDDGPNPIYTPLILDLLKHHQVPATFFLIGEHVRAHPDLARRALQEGHAIGNHTHTHLRLIGCRARDVANELATCQGAIHDAVGAANGWMRPPYGAHDRTASLVARANGYKLVNWSADGVDWTDTTDVKVTQAVVAGASPGGIILLHDGWNNPQPSWPEPNHVHDRMSTVRALPSIITQLTQAGYRFVTLPELARGKKPIKQMWF